MLNNMQNDAEWKNDQELATMINKGKGKLKWERDMPRDIEEKLEVTSSSFSVFKQIFEFE